MLRFLCLFIGCTIPRWINPNATFSFFPVLCNNSLLCQNIFWKNKLPEVVATSGSDKYKIQVI